MKMFNARGQSALLGAALLALAINAFAVPANPHPQTFKQPNGATIQGRLVGDESLHWMETLSGDAFLFNKKSGSYEYAIVEQIKGKNALIPSGVMVGASIAPSLVSTPGVTTKFIVNALWKEAHKATEALHLTGIKTPAKTGALSLASTALADVPLLVVIVDYSDNKIQSPDSTWQNKIFGSTEGTMNDYYREVSNGRFKYLPATETQGTANDGIVHVALNYPNPNPIAQDKVTRGVLTEVLGKVNQYVNFAQFDKDGDGTVDPRELSVIFVLAGEEYAYGGSTGGVWAHMGPFYSDEAPTTFDGTRIGRYAVFGERHADHDATMGVIAHEIGHLTFGLPDLYEPAGNFQNWDLMANGSWGMKNGDVYFGQTPPHMSGYCKVLAGFVTPTEVELMYAPANMSLYAPKNAGYNVAKILTNLWSEYFLVEQRRIEGYDRGITTDTSAYGKYGVMIYREESSRNGTRIVRANNVDSAAFALTDMYYPGNNTRLAPDTTPNSNLRGVDTAVVIENIALTADAMTVSIKRNDPNGYFCKQYAATNSAHVTAKRAYSATTGSWIKTTTYYANGSKQSLGTSATTSTTLKEAPPGYFIKGTCTQTNQKPVVQAITTNPTTFSTSAMIEVADAERDLVRAEYRLDGGAWTKADGLGTPTEGNFQYSAYFPRLASGSHQISARAYDAAGNVSAVYGPVTIAVPAQSAPVCDINRVNKDADGYYVAYGYASDPDVDMATLDMRVDGGAWQRASLDYLGNWSARTSAYPYGNQNGLALGTHTVEARSTDAGGRTGVCGPVNFLVGVASAPEIKSVTSSFVGTTVQINGSAHDVDGDVASVEYEVDNSGNWTPAEYTYINDLRVANFDIYVENLAVGPRAIRLRAHDSAGHISVVYTVNINLPAPVAPTCTFNRVFYDPAAMNYYLEGSFADINNDATRVEISYNQVDWYGVFALGGDFQSPLPNQPMANGEYMLYGRAWDQGDRSGTCGPLAFTINGYGTPPTVGTPTAVVSGLSVTVSGSAADQDSDLSMIEVQFDSDVSAVSTATGTSSWSLVNASLAAGTHKVRARAKDANNNTSAWSGWVSFTLAAPVSCYTATNSAHVTAGRATVKYTSLYYAVGSNTYLGSATTTTSLKLASPNNWAKVTSCP